MLLAININHTQIKVGGYDGTDLLVHWRIATDLDKTDDEYAMILRGLFQYAGLEFPAVESAAISSVVPPLTEVFERLCSRYFGVAPLVVGPGVRTGMRILYEHPKEVGADRICNAIAVYEKHGGPAIVVDFGTATTFTAVSAEGDFLGGAIAPGIGISVDAGRNGPTQEVALCGHGREGGRGAEIHHDGRPTMLLVYRDGIADAVGANLLGVFIEDAHAGAHSRPYDQGCHAEIPTAQPFKHLGQRGDYRRDRGRLHRRKLKARVLEQSAEDHRVLVVGLVQIGGDPPVHEEVGAVIAPDLDLRVVDVDGGQHGTPQTMGLRTRD